MQSIQIDDANCTKKSKIKIKTYLYCFGKLVDFLSVNIYNILYKYVLVCSTSIQVCFVIVIVQETVQKHCTSIWRVEQLNCSNGTQQVHMQILPTTSYAGLK